MSTTQATEANWTHAPNRNVNKRRLLKLADFLETVPRRKFDLLSWVQSMPTKPDKGAEGSCGFVGCAIGWAVHAKLFRGLRFQRPPYGDEATCSPEYAGLTGFRAIESLFDIGSNEARHLFADFYYPNYRATPKQVAKRIREFVVTQAVP